MLLVNYITNTLFGLNKGRLMNQLPSPKKFVSIVIIYMYFLIYLPDILHTFLSPLEFTYDLGPFQYFSPMFFFLFKLYLAFN